MIEMTKAEQVIELIANEGVSLIKACKKVGYTHGAFLAEIKREGLIDDYVRAREARADMMFEEMEEIANEKVGESVDDNGNIRLDSGWQTRQKLRIDTLKWILSRMNPKKYGDRIETVITEGKRLPEWMKEGDE